MVEWGSSHDLNVGMLLVMADDLKHLWKHFTNNLPLPSGFTNKLSRAPLDLQSLFDQERAMMGDGQV